ncbi:MAG: organomercurial lyase [Anaerolineaceae bacterium]
MTSESLDRDVRLFILQHFVESARPPTPQETGEALHLTLKESAAAYDRLASDHVLVLAPGTHEIRMANPLSAVQTTFPVHIGGKRFYGNCIWDALGAVAMLGGSGTIDSRCACCDEALTLEIDNLELRAVEAVVHFAVPAAHWWDDIVYT